ncbi:MAG: hypothetical protein HWE22_20535 [Flavobacteriales bacterium]|nr:hypothetical protein [Flavobacteriales bacterium]PIE86817.1 MAG: hypothetical protein CSA03_03505 [Bacteroidota bacterium]
MKKIMLIGSLGVFGVLALASCKKDYTCDCDENGVDFSIPDSKKKDAEKSCEQAATTWGANCSLKE